MRFTLKPDYIIDVKFVIKMLCTAVVQDEIGIIAADMDQDSKETAKLTIMVESDLSTKLDHTELNETNIHKNFFTDNIWNYIYSITI